MSSTALPLPAPKKPVPKAAKTSAAKVSVKAGKSKLPASPLAVASPVTSPVTSPLTSPVTSATQAKLSPTQPGKAPLQTPAKTRKQVKAVKPESMEKIERPRKPKLVRDSFTIPKSEYELLAALKTRAVRLHQPMKKSELLRAGIALLTELGDEAFLAAMQKVPALKTGRPKAEAKVPQ